MKICIIMVAHNYGCPLWNLWHLSSNVMSRFYVTWHKTIHQLFYIQHMTHCEILPVVADCKHIQAQLLCCMSKFVYNSISSRNKYLSMSMNLAACGSRSILP